jgi:hypothetical protein
VAKQLELVTGLVERINDKDTGINLDGLGGPHATQGTYFRKARG